jgi:response regulator RpfG family c-di-GMP phosphodiesterase
MNAGALKDRAPGLAKERWSMAGTNSDEKNKRFVLIMDSNVDDRFSTSMLLQRFGCNIFTAHSPAEAIEFMCVAPPAAVVSEAGQTGSEFLSRFKKDIRFSDVPLILLSASPDGLMEERARKGEIVAFLRKPINIEEFHRIVEEVIHKSRRKNIRVTTYLTASLEYDRSRDDGYVTVLSEYGLFFRTLEHRPANSRVIVNLDIKDRAVRLEAVVLYVSTFNEGPFREPGMGMKFVKIRAEDAALIKAFILERVEEGIGRQAQTSS